MRYRRALTGLVLCAIVFWAAPAAAATRVNLPEETSLQGQLKGLKPAATVDLNGLIGLTQQEGLKLLREDDRRGRG
jgi:hypothetical protein